MLLYPFLNGFPFHFRLLPARSMQFFILISRFSIFLSKSSLPLNGLFSFLLTVHGIYISLCMMCVNALERALLIPTLQETYQKLSIVLVSMPLNGLFSFLRMKRKIKNIVVIVSMPLNGLFSFLPYI